MSKLDKKPRSENHPGRTVHDLSHDFKFTAACGHILPIEADILLPGDKVDVSVDMYARNIQPFLAPAMANFDFHIDYFFVPMTLIYQPFASVVYGIQQEYSSNFNNLQGNGGLPLFSKSVYKNYMEQYGNTIPQDGFEPVGFGSIRLLDMFGINPVAARPSEAVVVGDYFPSFFPWQLAAYQCCYQYYFRDEDLEKFNNIPFNLDRLAQGTTINDLSFSEDNSTFRQLCKIRYHRAYNDYYLGISRSPLINENNLIGGNINGFGSLNNLLSVYNDLGSAAVFPSGQYYNDSNVEVPGNNPNALFGAAPLSLFEQNQVGDLDSGPIESHYNTNFSRTTDQLRKLFAVEKLVTITERNKKTYDAQTLGHFGIRVPHDVKHEISHFGHDKSSFHIGEITALASGSDGENGTTFGEYGGKGSMSLKGHSQRFIAPCHGVLLVSFSIVPRYDYNISNLKRNFVSNRLDFFQPEFDNLGMQPLYKYEVTDRISITPNSDSGSRVADASCATQVQGWQYRYEQFKRGVNRVTRAFTNNDLSAWTLQRTPFRNGNSFGSMGSFHTVEEINYYTWLYNSYGYVSPRDTDGIFAVPYLTDEYSEVIGLNPHLVYETDPFCIYSRINYRKVSIMSTYSMPKLD